MLAIILIKFKSCHLFMFQLSHLTVYVDIFFEFIKLFLLCVQSSQIILSVISSFGKLVRQLVQRRLKLDDVFLELSDARYLLGDDRTRRNVGAGCRLLRYFEFVVGASLFVDCHFQ